MNNERFMDLYRQTTGKDWTYDFDLDFAERFADILIKEIIQELQSLQESIAEIRKANPNDPSHVVEHMVAGIGVGITRIEEKFNKGKQSC